MQEKLAARREQRRIEEERRVEEEKKREAEQKKEEEERAAAASRDDSADSSPASSAPSSATRRDAVSTQIICMMHCKIVYQSRGCLLHQLLKNLLKYLQNFHPFRKVRINGFQVLERNWFLVL